MQYRLIAIKYNLKKNTFENSNEKWFRKTRNIQHSIYWCLSKFHCFSKNLQFPHCCNTKQRIRIHGNDDSDCYELWQFYSEQKLQCWSNQKNTVLKYLKHCIFSLVFFFKIKCALQRKIKCFRFLSDYIRLNGLKPTRTQTEIWFSIRYFMRTVTTVTIEFGVICITSCRKMRHIRHIKRIKQKLQIIETLIFFYWFYGIKKMRIKAENEMYSCFDIHGAPLELELSILKSW